MKIAMKTNVHINIQAAELLVHLLQDPIGEVLHVFQNLNVQILAVFACRVDVMILSWDVKR